MKKKLFLGVCISALLLFSCSSPPPPKPIVQNIHSAEMMINEAKDAGAETYAPLELKLAQEKVEEAKKALSQDDVAGATRLAKEAMLKAQNAESKSESSKMVERLKAEEHDVEMLKEELDRTQKTE